MWASNILFFWINYLYKLLGYVSEICFYFTVVKRDINYFDFSIKFSFKRFTQYC